MKSAQGADEIFGVASDEIEPYGFDEMKSVLYPPQADFIASAISSIEDGFIPFDRTDFVETETADACASAVSVSGGQ